MSALQDDIVKITEEVVNDGTIENIIREQITKGITEAIKDSFRYGDLKHAFESKIKECLVPYIENMDISIYNLKLENILTDIINNTDVGDTRKILENFDRLMKTPNIKTITTQELFKKYKDFVSESMDVSHSEVDTSGDEPCYEPITASFEIEFEEGRDWSCYKRGVIDFKVDDEEQTDDLNKSLHIQCWKRSEDEGYEITAECSPRIQDLRYLDDFTIYLLSLQRANVKLIIDCEYDDDEVYSDQIPEPTYN